MFLSTCFYGVSNSDPHGVYPFGPQTFVRAGRQSRKLWRGTEVDTAQSLQCFIFSAQPRTWTSLRVDRGNHGGPGNATAGRLSTFVPTWTEDLPIMWLWTKNLSHFLTLPDTHMAWRDLSWQRLIQHQHDGIPQLKILAVISTSVSRPGRHIWARHVWASTSTEAASRNRYS
jgi:hypothetical protein